MQSTEVTSEQQFHELRRTCIGGSDSAAVLGISEYKTPFDVYCEKRGLVDPVPDNEAMYVGRLLEDVILKEFEKEAGVPTVRKVFGRSEEYPFIGCNFDGLIYDHDGNVAAVVEAKNVGSFSSSEWGPNWSDEVPERYAIQVYHEMLVAGVEIGYLVAFLGGNRRAFYKLRRRQDMIDSMVAVYEQFWKAVQDGQPPEITGAASTTDTIRRMFPREEEPPREADEGILDLVRTYFYANQRLKEIQRDVDTFKNQLMAKIGPSEALTGPFGKITYKVSTSAKQIDWQAISALPEAIQEAIASVTKPGTEYRALRPYFQKGWPE